MDDPKVLSRTLVLGGVMLSAVMAFSAVPWESRALNPVTVEAVAGARPLSLVRDGKPCAVIVIPKRAADVTLSEIQYCPDGPKAFKRGRGAAEIAAAEIVRYMKRATGAELAVQTEEQLVPEGLLPIYVGASDAAAKAGFAADGLSPEGFRVTNDGKAVAIIGAPRGPREGLDGLGGVIFGAYDFLERFLGVRFYGHGELNVVVRPCRDVVVPAVTYADWPRHNQRVSYSWMWNDRPDNCAQETALRMRSGCNGWGSLTVFQHTPHELHRLFEGKDKEECVQLGRDGRRSQTNPPVPCFGNPKTMDYILKAWELWYAGDARGKEAIQSSFPVKDALGYSCPDHPGRCCCRFCAGRPEPTAPVGRYSAGYERRSDLVGGFAARLSHAAQAKFPDKRFYWLPYSEYCTPPKGVDFSDNSYFRLCYMMGTSTYLDPVVQKTYRRWTDAWIKAGRGKRIYGYLYTWPDIDDGIRVPFEFSHALKAFYRDHVDRVEGYFLCFQPEPWLHPLSLYCQMRLLWNPDFDVDACAAEMYADLFGPAAKLMKALYGRPTWRWESTPASTYGNALTGGPGDYMGPHVTKDECFTRLFPAEDATATERDLAAVDALEVPDDVRERLVYFTEPFRMLVKRRAFWQAGEKADAKTLHAEPCSAETTPLRLDGVLDEPFWKQAVADDLVCAKFALYTDRPDVPTRVRAARVDTDDPARRGLAIALEMTEPEMDRRVNTATDNTIYFDDCVELFFDASAKDGQKSGDYRQYVIASDGRFMSINIHEGVRIGSFEKDCSFGALKRSDHGWTVELFIPETGLMRGVPAGERAAVKSVKANFCRTRRLKRANGEAYRFVSRWRTDYGDGNGDVKQMGDILLRD